MRYMSRWALLLLDLMICSIAAMASMYVLEWTGIMTYDAKPVYYFTRSLTLLTIQIFGFWIFHTYAGVLRYSGYIDAVKLLLAQIITLLILYALHYAYLAIYKEVGFFSTAIFIPTYCVSSYILLVSLRMFVKVFFDYMNISLQEQRRVVIYGIDQQAVALAKLMRTSFNSSYRLIGMIDSEGGSGVKDILGNRVYDNDDKLITRLHRHQVYAVVLPDEKVKDNDKQRLDELLSEGFRLLMSTGLSDINYSHNGNIVNDRLRSMKIEDLLERPSINMNLDSVSEQLNNRIIMITGAAGSIGSEIVRQIATFKPTLLLLVEQAETPLHELSLELRQRFHSLNFLPCIADVRDRERLERLFSQYEPNIIYHAAAYKHVPLMEENPSEAVKANILGTKNLADLAVKYHVERFVMISTDKAVNPTNIMGASKRIAEIYVQSLFQKKSQEFEAGNRDILTKFITTRFGNVLGSNGSVVPYFKRQIEAGGPVTVTHPDIIRYFMTIPEACQLVLEAGCMGKGGEIFAFDMGKPVKILDLATKMIRLAGYEPGKDIEIRYTGLRPGEKLYEELLNKKETSIPTDNKKIMIARVRENDYDTIAPKIDSLITMSQQGKEFSTVKQMKAIVPEFISQNSPFEQLDEREPK
ncbi:MAG TPA: polysaccharide biosynthesis protein [Bacteroidales bacterium]|nr:polysaccharide biosynthesis protein [Bacteroidales bacterium]